MFCGLWLTAHGRREQRTLFEDDLAHTAKNFVCVNPRCSENGRPVGPDDGPCGPERRESHQHPSLPTRGRPSHENHSSFPAAGDHPAPQTSPRPKGPAIPPARPSGPGKAPPPPPFVGPTGQQFVFAQNVARTINLAAHQPRKTDVISTARLSPAQLSRTPAAPPDHAPPTPPAPRRWRETRRLNRADHPTTGVPKKSHRLCDFSAPHLPPTNLPAGHPAPPPRATTDPSGVTEGSRGSTEATTPGPRPPHYARTPKVVPEIVAQPEQFGQLSLPGPPAFVCVRVR
jgi:hypothetical protein